MSALPLFYYSGLKEASASAMLDEETRRHVVTVLRMQPGECIMLTDGSGTTAVATIEQADKKKLVVAVEKLIHHPSPEKKVILGLALLKNAARFEWMLEKITEIGVTEIIPILSERTERQHFRHDRFAQILISASLQSGRFHFPALHAPMKFQHLFDLDLPAVRYIAHCIDGEKKKLSTQESHSVVLIGPEGDFTSGEIELAIKHQFCAVTLGNTRLRSETAGVVAATLIVS